MKSVMIIVLGCIHSTGVGFLTNVEKRLNEDAYIDLLGNYMISRKLAYLASIDPTPVISLLLFVLLGLQR